MEHIVFEHNLKLHHFSHIFSQSTSSISAYMFSCYKINLALSFPSTSSLSVICIPHNIDKFVYLYFISRKYILLISSKFYLVNKTHESCRSLKQKRKPRQCHQHKKHTIPSESSAHTTLIYL